ncbi:pogo transposable element with krab domain-like protein [Lasius niger]|uniref:Pogo transposable element with krab domain-like protein n=1 Tax=Lasius niger TaxID=67767 RepID=A0A0J7K2Q0_LASNI|nr:pogo transposable element with krab domain-like protein [Lasius niger]
MVLAPKGQKRVGSITAWERGKNITVICAMSAAGTYVPPLFIFPRKRHSLQLENGSPLAAVYKCTPNGWTTEQIFLKWLNHFKDFVKPT